MATQGLRPTFPQTALPEPRVKNVIFVAPWFAPTTLRFIRAVAALPGVRVGLVSQDPAAKLPRGLRAHLFAHQQIERGLDPDQILTGVGRLAARMGPPSRLLGALEELQVPLGHVRDRLGIPGMGEEAARNFRDKARMKSVLRGAGVPCAHHLLATSVGEGKAFAAHTGYPLVAKPPEGSGSRATYRLESDADLEECLTALRVAAERPVLLEEFIQGDEHSFDAISVGGRVVWHSINHYLPTPLEVLEEPWIQWCVLLPREVDGPRYADVRDAGQQSLAALGMGTGISHMEWFRRTDGSLAVSEVAARPPGARFVDLISYAHDFDMYAAWARTVVFDAFEPKGRPYAAGAAYLRAQGQGDRIGRVRGLDVVARELGSMIVSANLPRPGQPRSGTYEGDGTIVVRHPDTEAVERALALIVRTVRVEPVESTSSASGAPT